jgi:hypothetical protein
MSRSTYAKKDWNYYPLPVDTLKPALGADSSGAGYLSLTCDGRMLLLAAWAQRWPVCGVTTPGVEVLDESLRKFDHGPQPTSVTLGASPPLEVPAKVTPGAGQSRKAAADAFRVGIWPRRGSASWWWGLGYWARLTPASHRSLHGFACATSFLRLFGLAKSLILNDGVVVCLFCQPPFCQGYRCAETVLKRQFSRFKCLIFDGLEVCSERCNNIDGCRFTFGAAGKVNPQRSDTFPTFQCDLCPSVQPLNP